MDVNMAVFTHEHLWRAVEVLYKDACSNTHGRYAYLPCLAMTYFAFEAFVNYLGETLRPDLWADEKAAFRGASDTIEAKIDAIVHELPGYEKRWKGKQPYQDIKKLKRFRDLVTHGRVVRSEHTIPNADESAVNRFMSDFRWSHHWDAFVEPTAVARSMSSVKAFCQSLVTEARKHSDEPHLQFSAFEGALGLGEGS